MAETEAAFEFDVHMDPAAAAAAERAFVARSRRELRKLETFVAPAFFAAVALAAYFFGLNVWIAVFFGALSAFAVSLRVVMSFLRSTAAARFARQHPVRRLRLAPEALSVTTGAHVSDIPWNRFSAVWDAGDALLLVLSAHTSLSIPKRSLPEGACNFMEQAISAARHKGASALPAKASRNLRFVTWLSQKRNFMIFSQLSVGLPVAVGMIWWLGHVGFPRNLFLMVVAIGASALGAYVFGVLFWFAYVKDRFESFRPAHQTPQGDGKAST